MIEIERLHTFALLNTLSHENLEKVAQHMTVGQLAPGEILFRLGERDPLIFFLLEGSVKLHPGDGSPPLLIEAGTDAAVSPLSRLKPRRYTAQAATTATLIAIDEDWLDQLLTADQSTAYEVSLIEGEDPEWMFRIISSESFRKVPVDNMTALFSKLTPVDAVAGQVLIHQGEPGDYYYMIRHGRAKIERRLANGEQVQVAEIGVGESFGEEALLSGEPRNATVSMIEDGQLMRLSQADFNAVLRPALVRRVAPREALMLIKRGAKFLDVRTEAEFHDHALPGSINLPLCDLRRLTDKLSRETPYITVCQTGRRCTSAAFLLGQRGFDVYVLRDGLDAIDLKH